MQKKMDEVTKARTKMWNVRMSQAERRRLDRIARHYGLNGANTIRMLIKKAYDQEFKKMPAKGSE